MLVHELQVEAQSSTAIQWSATHHMPTPIDMACTGLLVKFVALQLQGEERKAESAEVEDIASTVDALQHDSRRFALPEPPTQLAADGLNKLAEQLFDDADQNN